MPFDPHRRMQATTDPFVVPLPGDEPQRPAGAASETGDYPPEQRGDNWLEAHGGNGATTPSERTSETKTNGRYNPTAKDKKPPSWGEPIPASLLQLPVARPWLWEGYLAPGNITLLSALWKAGKTTLLWHLLKVFEQGGTFCGKNVEASRVLYVTEESEGRWAKRRDDLLLTDNVSFFVRPFLSRPDWSDWSAFILHVSDWIKGHPVGLVVFDPLVNLWPVRDENDNAQVLSALLPLHNITKQNAGLLLAHHVRKGDGNEATASRGAGSLTGFVDTIIELRRFNAGDRHDRRRVLTAYGRDEETPEELVVELDKTARTYTAQGDRAESAMSDMMPVILSILPTEPPGWSKTEILENWPEGKAGPGSQRLVDALHRGTRNGDWILTGDGKRGSPHCWYREVK